MSAVDAAFERTVDVRWRDTDALGHVNHAVFLTYLEEGRDAFYSQVTGGDPIYVVVRLEIDLRAEVRHPDRRVRVRIAVERLGTTSLTTRETVLTPGGRGSGTGAGRHGSLGRRSGPADPVHPGRAGTADGGDDHRSLTLPQGQCLPSGHMSTHRATPPRRLDADGLVNARDLGGLRRVSGGYTPRGVFYRSENTDRITPAGWEQIRAVGIRTVVDLRQPAERARDTGRRPGWLTTLAADLDGLENQDFWRHYWDNGLAGTALYYLPQLRAMPERAGAALSAIVSAPPGGVLFHCLGGRDRTGLIAMLLLAAAGTEPGEIVDDYLQTVRLGDQRAAAENGANAEPEIEAFCQARGTTTEGAFRAALAGLDITRVLTAAKISRRDRIALTTWRGSLPDDPPGSWLARDAAEFVHFGRLPGRGSEVGPPA